MSSFAESNPLLSEWSNNYGMPPFEQITPNLFESGLRIAMDEHVKEIHQIATNEESATFTNTIIALENAGSLFTRINDCFSNMCSSVGTPELQVIELKMTTEIASHYNKITTYPNLFQRVEEVYNNRNELGLNELQIRLVERYHLDAVKAGAKFNTEQKQRYKEIVEELAALQTQFSQNVMKDEAQIYLELNDTPEDLAGLPEDLVTAAKQAAIQRISSSETNEECKADVKPIITLSRSLVEPFLIYSERRDLREKAWKLWTRRGELNPERDNLKIAKRLLELRQEQANMHGFSTFAEFNTDDTMAGSPQKVLSLLEDVWSRAKVSISKERAELEKYMVSIGQDPSELEPFDWRFYAEKVRQRNYDLDNSAVKAYFPLKRMINAIFDCAGKLFNLSFVPRNDIRAYHEDVQVYEVVNKDTNELVAIFLHDNYARPNKRSGAWMSELRSQYYTQGKNNEPSRVIPIVLNNNNFNKPMDVASSDCLLSFDDARTLFHEFGHGLHGMLSNVQYRRLASTNVLKDFVELPSQLYEHWLEEEAVLQEHARHHQTNEVINKELLHKIFTARSFGQAFQTVEFTASALLDMKLHQMDVLQAHKDLDLSAWEKQQLQALDMPKSMIMRHRLPHFQHMFSSEFYAAGYYVYLWAEVLDADAFDAFKETGDCFNADVAKRVYNCIYSAGNSKDPAQLFRDFRGRDPIVEPMLKKKGLL